MDGAVQVVMHSRIISEKRTWPIDRCKNMGRIDWYQWCTPLIDGGNVTAPTFRMYNPDGTWFKEGHGVDPDIAVPEDLGAMAKGIDPQLERAITEIKKALKDKGYTAPKQPGYEKRN